MGLLSTMTHFISFHAYNESFRGIGLDDGDTLDRRSLIVWVILTNLDSFVVCVTFPVRVELYVNPAYIDLSWGFAKQKRAEFIIKTAAFLVLRKSGWKAWHGHGGTYDYGMAKHLSNLLSFIF